MRSARIAAGRKRGAFSILRWLFVVAIVGLAALSTARADVQEFDPPGQPTDIDFTGDADKDAPDPWLEAFLRRTWLEIWIELLRDEIFVDTTDTAAGADLTAALHMLGGASLGSDALSPLQDAARLVAACRNTSASIECQIMADLLAAGWTDPNSASTPWSAGGQSPTSGGGASFPNGYSFTQFLQATGASGSSTPFSGACCKDFNQNDSYTGGAHNNFQSLSIPFSSSYDSSGSSTYTSGSQSSGGRGVPSAPEPSVPTMLLMGLCAIALATRIRTFRRSAA